MKILHYVDDKNLSWSRPWIQILNELRKFECENIIVCQSGGNLSDLCREAGFHVYTYKPPVSFCPCLASGFRDILKLEKPDIIHTRLSSAARTGGYWGTRLSIPVLATIDKFPKAKYYKKITHLLPCSSPVAEYMRSIGFPENKMTVLYNAVDVDFYAIDLKKRQSVRDSVGIDNNKICFLGMGRFVDWKGFDDLISAFAEFLKNQDNPENFYLWLAGDGDERDKLKKLTQQLGLSDRVRFWGFIQDVRPVLWAADIYIHPSWGDEAFGLSLLEAMAAGLPVIASNSGGINEILNNHQGLIFNRRDIKAIAHCMEEAVMNLKNALNSGHAALERAMDFDVKNIARETFEIYKKYIK